jgi:predicted TIM-barrel fold metal-dependent hydrolase
MGSYAGDRAIHDADSHVMELPSWSEKWLPEDLRARVAPPPNAERARRLDLEGLARRHDDPEYRAKLDANVMGAKGVFAAGAFRSEDRPWALDRLGFRSQLVFTTLNLGGLAAMERADDTELAYRYARAHNEAMLDFCAVDERLLPVCYVPLCDLERAPAFADGTLASGAAALMIASACPRLHAPSHVGLDPIWASAERARIPILFHVGGGGHLMDAVYKENGLPPVPDFTGGDGNFTSVSFMAIPGPPMQTLATLIFDGVLERFPELRIGVIEQGAAWVPGWMRSMDSAAHAFRKNEERLGKLSLRPSEYVRRQVRVTPYPHEPAGWIVKNTGAEVCLFSSDYPHIEGGRNPIKRFEESLSGCTPEEREGFWWRNYEDLMGAGLPEALRVGPCT